MCRSRSKALWEILPIAPRCDPSDEDIEPRKRFDKDKNGGCKDCFTDAADIATEAPIGDTRTAFASSYFRHAADIALLRTSAKLRSQTGERVMLDMTMSEVLRDPLIRQVLRADGTSLGSFAQLLEKAARNHALSQSARLGQRNIEAEFAQTGGEESLLRN